MKNEDLRKLAEKAYEDQESSVWLHNGHCCVGEPSEDQTFFIEECSPQTILAMLDVVEAAKEFNELDCLWYEGALKQHRDSAKKIYEVLEKLEKL